MAQLVMRRIKFYPIGELYNRWSIRGLACPASLLFHPSLLDVFLQPVAFVSVARLQEKLPLACVLLFLRDISAYEDV